MFNTIFPEGANAEKILGRYGIKHHPLVERRRASCFDIFTMIQVWELIDNLLITKRKKNVRAKRAHIKSELHIPLSPHDCIALWAKIPPYWPKKRSKLLVDSFWGYNDDLRNQVTIPLLEQLDREAIIWSTIIDWWSWLLPLWKTLWWDKKIVAVDHVAWENIDIVTDLTCLQKRPSFNRSIFEQKLFALLDGDDPSLMICSDILNYVHTNEFLSVISSYQKTGGRMLIVNGVNRWEHSIFHLKRIQTIQNLLRTLSGLWYNTELHNEYYPETIQFWWGIFSNTIRHKKNEDTHVSSRSTVDVVLAKKL